MSKDFNVSAALSSLKKAIEARKSQGEKNQNSPEQNPQGTTKGGLFYKKNNQNKITVKEYASNPNNDLYNTQDIGNDANNMQNIWNDNNADDGWSQHDEVILGSMMRKLVNSHISRWISDNMHNIVVNEVNKSTQAMNAIKDSISRDILNNEKQ